MLHKNGYLYGEKRGGEYIDAIGWGWAHQEVIWHFDAGTPAASLKSTTGRGRDIKLNNKISTWLPDRSSWTWPWSRGWCFPPWSPRWRLTTRATLWPCCCAPSWPGWASAPASAGTHGGATARCEEEDDDGHEWGFTDTSRPVTTSCCQTSWCRCPPADPFWTPLKKRAFMEIFTQDARWAGGGTNQEVSKELRRDPKSTIVAFFTYKKWVCCSFLCVYSFIIPARLCFKASNFNTTLIWRTASHERRFRCELNTWLQFFFFCKE